MYIGSTSGTGEIHFKNNISSTDAPHSSGDTKMVITDTGVGIGTNSPSSWGNGQNQLVVGDGTGDNGITIYSQNNANSNLRFSDGTSGSEQYRGRVEYDHVNDKLYLGAGGITPFVIDSSGNVGSGAVPKTWSLGKALHIGNPENCFWAEGDYAFHMTQNGYYNSGWKYTHTDEASIYTIGDGKHIWLTAPSGTADTTLTWTEKARIDTDGLKFNGDTAAANALSDYEEGTMTMTLNTTGNAPSVNEGRTFTGYYTKVGQLVNCWGYTGARVITGVGTGIAKITGLPFTINDAYGVGTLTHCTMFASGGNTTAYLETGTDAFYPLVTAGTSGVAYVTGTRYMMFHVVYRTNS